MKDFLYFPLYLFFFHQFHLINGLAADDCEISTAKNTESFRSLDSSSLKTAEMPHGKLTLRENRDLQKNCGHYLSRDQKSFGGTRAHRNEAPWVVSFAIEGKYKGTNNAYTQLHCSGTLISNRHILTASHCFNKKYFDRIRFVFDDDCGASESHAKCSINNSITRRAVKVIGPPYYRIPGDKDVAIYELDQPIDFGPNLYPACLSETRPRISDKLDLYSYGRNHAVDNYDTASGSLQHVQLTTVKCLYAQSVDTLCALDKKQRTLEGDSGGGLTYKKYGKAYVTGLISGSSMNEDHDVAVAHHLSWICNHTGICVSHKRTKQIRSTVNAFPN